MIGEMSPGGDQMPVTKGTVWSNVPSAYVMAAGLSVVIVVSMVRGLAGGFVAMADDSAIAVGARDVLTPRNPLVGMGTSASFPGDEFNHPGPMLYQLLALPVRLFGDSAGIAIGAAVTNVVAVVLIAVICVRLVGHQAASVVLAAVCAVAWVMGSEVLYSAWNPNIAILPFLLFVVAMWAIACGRVRYVPVAVLAGSFCVQAHLGFAIPVVGAMAAGAFAAWRWPINRVSGRQWRRWLTVGGLIGIACWALPLWEQFTAAGRGNVSRIVASARQADETVGWRAFTVLADALAPTSWWRPSLDEAWILSGDSNLPSAPVTALVLVAAAVVVTACLLEARRVRRRSPSRLVVVVAAVMLGGVASLATRPPQFGVAVGAHTMRWIWPAVAMLIAATVLAALPRRWRGHAAAVGTAIGVLALVLTLPTHGLQRNRRYYDTVSDIRTQVADSADLISDDVTVRVEVDGMGFLFYPYDVLAALDRAGVDVAVDNPTAIRQFGPSRADDGSAGGEVWVVVGETATQAPPSAIRLAYVERSPDGPVGVFYREVSG